MTYACSSATSAISTTQDVLVSVIVPMLNEVENVDYVLAAILAQNAAFPLEILVADGGSTDGTVERAQAWRGKVPIRIIPGGHRRGLAADVLAAAGVATADIIVVIDADLSHPPGQIAELVQPIIDGISDMVVGSRYTSGGATPDWPWPRQLLSRLGGMLAWPLTELSDPMSGFLAVRRDLLLAVDPAAAGFKIGLEIMAQAGDTLRLTEVPIVFRDRVRGSSKIGLGQMAAYARRLMVLAGGAISIGNATRFAGVGLVGLALDLFIFQIIFGSGFGLVAAHAVSFSVATVSNYLLNSRWAFAAEAEPSPDTDWQRYGRFLTVCLLAFAIRGGVLAGTINILGWPPQVAILLGVATAATVNYLGTAFFVFPSVNPRVPPNIRWRIAAIGVLGYVLILRLVFMGIADLLPEEAYYWNYAQHLDIGYLDHPPMVAWLIWLGTSVFGDTEFGVRIGALLAWLATAYFTFQLSRNLFGKSAAFVSILLIATLPFFFSAGLLMMPDAPLTAAWAGTLYFLERALLAERRSAWWGVGICLGLGLLSKYTIALLGPAALLFVLLDARARRWILRPEPYLALTIAALLFSPVIVWNATHDWASFAFQGPRRLESSFQFSLPVLVSAVAVLLTPVGLIAASASLISKVTLKPLPSSASASDRGALFITVATLVPLAVFTAFSLFHSMKLNWTGPLWLALLPLLATTIVAADSKVSRAERFVRKLWVPAITVMLVVYGLSLHYLVLGFPLAGYFGNLSTLPVAWQEFGREAGLIEREVEHDTGGEVFVVGLDKYFVSSELAFYNREDRDAVQTSVGRSIFGRDSLMYDYWFHAAELTGMNIIMFALQEDELKHDSLSYHFSRLGDIQKRFVIKNGDKAGYFFYRIGYTFRPNLENEAKPHDSAELA